MREIHIDRSICDGCGLCVNACHEGALALVDGKAVLVRRDFCDGMGDCLPACPQGAISFVEVPSGISTVRPDIPLGAGPQWPIQLALVPGRSPVFEGSVVFAADCTAFVVDDFKGRILDGRPVVIGCPKLDDRARFDKVLAMIRDNPLDSVEVVRMGVPCCRSLTDIVRKAAEQCGRDVKVKETIVSRDGSTLRSMISRPRAPPGTELVPRESLITLDEIQSCPRARLSLEQFTKDDRLM